MVKARAVSKKRIEKTIKVTEEDERLAAHILAFGGLVLYTMFRNGDISFDESGHMLIRDPTIKKKRKSKSLK